MSRLRAYVARRILLGIIVLLGVSVVTFMVARVLPSEPAARWVGPRATAEQIARARVELGLDRPLHVQYYRYMRDLLGGNWGMSIRTHQPVIRDIKVFLPATLELTIVGMFIQVGTQLLATVPLLSVLFHLPPPVATAAATLLMVAYLIGGGFWSSGMVGLVKMSLLAAGILTAGLTAFRLLGGWPGVLGTFPAFPWLSLWPEGVPEGLADGFSVVVGLFSTQTYVSALLAARDTATARRGFVASALLIVAVGLAGVAVGLFMRAAAPSLRAAEALPAFLLGYCPAWLGGLALAALLISLITTGAGLTMGIATILMEDFYPLLRPRATERQKLAAARVLILLLGGAAFSFTLAGLNTTIFHWAFLSMALRGVTVFVPLLAAVTLGPRVPPVAGRAAVILAPPLVLVWGLVWPAGPDPLYPGLAASLLILLAAGLLTRRGSRTTQQGHEPDHR